MSLSVFDVFGEILTRWLETEPGKSHSLQRMCAIVVVLSGHGSFDRIAAFARMVAAPSRLV